MATIHQLLSAVRSMQPNAQAALPVIPNNGNPAGAHNMPHQVLGDATPVAPQPTRPDLSWLQPSQSMANLRNRLSRRQEYIDNRLGTIRRQMSPQEVQPQQPAITTPVMSQPAIPDRGLMRRVVLPQGVEPNQWNGM